MSEPNRPWRPWEVHGTTEYTPEMLEALKKMASMIRATPEQVEQLGGGSILRSTVPATPVTRPPTSKGRLVYGQLGADHVHALSVARSAVLKAARKFHLAADRYRSKDLTRSAQQMADSGRACTQVASFLADEIVSARAVLEESHDDE